MLDTWVALDWSEEGEAPPLVVVGNIYMLSQKVQWELYDFHGQALPGSEEDCGPSYPGGTRGRLTRSILDHHVNTRLTSDKVLFKLANWSTNTAVRTNFTTQLTELEKESQLFHKKNCNISLCAAERGSSGSRTGP
ncbi:unnamed protein product [Leuciscus chuanchicus]